MYFKVRSVVMILEFRSNTKVVQVLAFVSVNLHANIRKGTDNELIVYMAFNLIYCAMLSMTGMFVDKTKSAL